MYGWLSSGPLDHLITMIDSGLSSFVFIGLYMMYFAHN